MSFKQNPYGWGFGTTSTVTSQSLLVYFTDVSASEIPRSDLNDTQLVQLSMGEAEETGASQLVTYCMQMSYTCIIQCKRL